jgi:pentatricopeptide repeat protein
MRHVRILNQFISSILPQPPTPLLQRSKSLTACLGCGRFQLTPRIMFSTMSLVQNTHINKKYECQYIKVRPAEPSIAIKKLSTQRRSLEALGVYLKLVRDGGVPSREALHLLIRSLYISKNLLGLNAIHDTLVEHYRHHKLSRRNARAMIYMYTMLINLVAKTTYPTDLEAIRRLCSELQQFSQHANTPLYNTLIRTLLQVNQVQQAHALFEDMKLYSKPTMVTYGILMKDASRRRDFKQLMSCLDDIEKGDGLEIDYATVSVIVTTLCSVQRFDKAIEVVQKIHVANKRDELSSPKYRDRLLQLIDFKRRKYKLKNNKKKGTKA